MVIRELPIRLKSNAARCDRLGGQPDAVEGAAASAARWALTAGDRPLAGCCRRRVWMAAVTSGPLPPAGLVDGDWGRGPARRALACCALALLRFAQLRCSRLVMRLCRTNADSPAVSGAVCVCLGSG